jgi:NADP-dependent 3-hydroxy acid dehydrogenase YdfG
VADAQSVALAATQARRELGGAPDIIVNNAGLFQITPIAALSPEEFAGTIQTNLVAPFFVLREFLPAMYERGTGHVVTIGSTADRNIFPGNGAYSASKYGARALHEVLRTETQGTGIRATLVSPSGVDTDLWDGVTFVGSDIPPDRTHMLHASAVAEAVLFVVTRPVDVNVDELRLSRA